MEDRQSCLSGQAGSLSSNLTPDVLVFLPPFMSISSLFQLNNFATAMPLIFALVLLVILIISFRSRAVVFTQYLEAMTGIRLKPSDVRRVYNESGKNGVRLMFLDLIIREDLKEGPMEIQDEQKTDEEVAVH